MREKYLWLAIIFLLLLTVGQACYIYERNALAKEISAPPSAQPEIYRKAYAEKAYDAQWEELEKWRGKVREQISQGFPLLDPDFDDFFNDRFFSGSVNPFAEMERVHRQVSGEFRDADKTLFDGYWDKWFQQRMKMGQFKTELTRTDKDVTITIRVPGLAAKTADINITDDRIRIAFSAKTSSEERSGEGIVKKETSQSYIKILPVPGDAVRGTGKVEIGKDEVKIKFERKKG